MQEALKRARLGMSLQFLTNGALFGTLLPHYPQIKDTFGLSPAAFGLAVVGAALGSVTTAAFAGRFVRRFGALRVATIGTFMQAGALALAATSRLLLIFVVGLFLAGMLDAILDTGQNVHGLAVERVYGSSIINSLHAIWSLGAVLGGLLGTASVASGWTAGHAMILSGVAWSAVAYIAYLLADLPAPEQAVDSSGSVHIRHPGQVLKLVAPLVLLAISGTLVEEIGTSCSAIFARDAVGASAGTAGLAYVAAFAAQFVGRMAADPLTDRIGRSGVTTLGGVFIACGALTTGLAPNLAIALLGFSALGLGCATMVPAAYAAAHELPGLNFGTGVAMISWLMRAGFLLASPAFGALAEWSNLSAGMVLPFVAGALSIAVARRFLTRAPSPPAPQFGA
jgi:MFS family permease